MPRQSKPLALRDRIQELVRLPAASLQDHAGNWRVHPQAQAEAMAGVLRDVGVVNALLVYQSVRQGGLTVIDGHLRKGLHPEQDWPCLLLDVDDAEADYLLATHDPLTGMAEADTVRLAALLHEVQSGESAVQALLSQLAQEAGIVPPEPAEPPDEFKEYDEDIETEHTCPKCGYQFSGGS